VGLYTRSHDTLITDREYRDNAAPVAVKYRVRAAVRVTAGSGSYPNLSQGAFWP
jgi:hypothetical protein